MNNPSKANLEPLLSAALKVFVRHGYRNTTIELITQETTIAEREICRHFSNKEELFMALIDRVTRHRTPIISSLESLDKQPRVGLPRMAARMLAKMNDKEYLAIIRIIIGESGSSPELAEFYMTTIIDHSNQYLSDYFASHPELKIKDPEATARIFLGALIAFDISQGVLYGDRTSHIEHDRIINTLVDLVLAHADR